MSGGWDAAVERAALGTYCHFKGAHPLTEKRWTEDGEWVRDEHRKLARAALTAAVGPGGLILEVEDVATLRTVIDNLNDVIARRLTCGPGPLD